MSLLTLEYVIEVLLLKPDDALTKGADLLFTEVVICLEGLLVHDSSLLSQLLVLLLEDCTVLLHLRKGDLLIVQGVVQGFQFVILVIILLDNVLQLLTGVT